MMSNQYLLKRRFLENEDSEFGDPTDSCDVTSGCDDGQPVALNEEILVKGVNDIFDELRDPTESCDDTVVCDDEHRLFLNCSISWIGRNCSTISS